MKLLVKCITIFSFFLLYGCKQEKQDEIVAQVYGYKLERQDVLNIYPPNCTKEDSVLCLQNFVNNWINTMVVLRKAEKNLDEKQKDFSKQLQEYKNSLIIHAYKELLIQQMPAQSVMDDEVLAYYESHKDEFLLTNNIVKVWYVKVDKDSPHISKFKQALYKKDEHELIELCEKFAINYFIDDAWLLFDDLLKEIPIETYNHELYLKYTRNISVADNMFTYLAVIRDFKIKESVSPFSFEKEKIRSILLNQKKLNLIETMNVELKNSAEQSGEIKIFDKRLLKSKK